MVYTTETPTVNDVLCGKDKTYSKHPGNQIYRKLIERIAEAYGNEPSKQIKMQMTKDIVNTMECTHHSKFLRKTNEGYWEEITKLQARDKTSHALRYCSASLLKKKKQQKQTKHSNKQGSSKKNSKQNNIAPPSTTTTASTTTKKTRKHHRRIVSADSNATTSNHNNGPRTAKSYQEIFQSQQQETLYGNSFIMDDETAAIIFDFDSITFPVSRESSDNNSLAHPPPLSSRVKSEEIEAILKEPIEQDWMDNDFFSMI